MAWSLAILDDGITKSGAGQLRQADHGIEHDFYDGTVDTDERISRHTRQRVFRSALKVSRSLDVIDLKVGASRFGRLFRLR